MARARVRGDFAIGDGFVGVLGRGDRGPLADDGAFTTCTLPLSSTGTDGAVKSN